VTKYEAVDWIDLAQDRIQLWAHTNKEIFFGSIKYGESVDQLTAG
jgi:hypothetical protein